MLRMANMRAKPPTERRPGRPRVYAEERVALVVRLPPELRDRLERSVLETSVVVGRRVSANELVTEAVERLVTDHERQAEARRQGALRNERRKELRRRKRGGQAKSKR